MEKNKDQANILRLTAEYLGLWAMEKFVRPIAEVIDDAFDIDFGDLEDEL